MPDTTVVETKTLPDREKALPDTTVVETKTLPDRKTFREKQLALDRGKRKKIEFLRSVV